MTKALSATCHCGAVDVQIVQAPAYLNECNCTFCNSPPAVAEKVASGFSSATASTEYPVWWGYFDPPDVVVTGETRVYARADREEPAVELHFCGVCGCTTHWTLLPVFLEKVGENKCGVNMRLFDRGELAGIELRFPDGANWDGVGQWGFFRPHERVP